LKNYDFIKRFNISKQYEKDKETEMKTNRTQQEKYRTQYNTHTHKRKPKKNNIPRFWPASIHS